MDEESLNVHVWPNSDCYQCKIGTLLMHFICMYVYICVKLTLCCSPELLQMFLQHTHFGIVNTLVHTTTPESTEN